MMTRLIRYSFVCSLLLACFMLPLKEIKSQSVAQCGSIIEGQIAKDQEVHKYSVNLKAGDRLDLYLITQGNYQDLKVNLGITAPNGFIIRNVNNYNSSNFVQADTAPISQAGDYTLSVVGSTSTGGSYKLSVSCTDSKGNVTSNGEFTQTAKCGSLIQNKFTRNQEYHLYYIYLSQGDSATVSIEVAAGAYQDLKVNLGITSPSGFRIRNMDNYNFDTTVKSDAPNLTDTGVYIIEIVGYTSTAGGPYTLFIACNIGGKLINPGDASPPTPQPTAIGNAATATPFSGIGFQGLPPIDFSNAITVSLQSTGNDGKLPPNGNTVLGYTFQGKAGAKVDLNFTRTSGNLNLGLVVLSANNEVVFQASLVTSSALTTQFTLPTDGEYTIGVFKIDLLPPNKPEATAFQIKAKIS